MNLVVGITGASGAWAARLLLEKSPWPVALVVSDAGRSIYEKEVGSFAALEAVAAETWSNTDLSAPIASGSVPTRGMVVLPCSANTLGKIAAGISDSLITRAAHCHLKENRRLILGVRETPWSLPNLRAAETVSASAGVIMPLSPPFYMFGNRDPSRISMHELLDAYVERMLTLLGATPKTTWADIR
jgi:4-hydroxy-3-polyprenylbenzoate decarboxylase